MRAWLLVLLAGCAASPVEDVAAPAQEATAPGARVVVATFDTGTNPFHPCWQLNGTDIAAALPEIAATVRPLLLERHATYEDSLEANAETIAAIEDHALYHVAGTRLLFYGGQDARDEFIDMYPHGAQASSQIACAEHGLAPDAWLLVLNWYDTQADRLAGMEWVSQQPWIDVVHLNIQRVTVSPPVGTPERDLIAAMAAAGQYVVLANGNGWGNAAGHIPSETIDFNSIHATHLAGSNDGTGYTHYSNPDPHTVMDGCGTIAAEPHGFGTTTFGGTSSASPRTTGYVAALLLELRTSLGVAAGQDGALVLTEPLDAGPLNDGRLDRVELHEVVRKTADERLAASRWDEGTCLGSLPRYLPAHDYHRVGYGKLTEDTLEHALAVLLGQQAMPARAEADFSYAASTAVRDAYWSVA